MNSVPRDRIRDCNQAPVRADRPYVLYWMIAARRTCWNFALDRAIELARQMDRPLVVLEALRCDYLWASDRIHRFIIDGMRDNRSAFKDSNVFYYAYVEPEQGAGKGLLEALAEDACAVVTDEFPCFFLPRMVAAASQRLKVKLEAVDGNGLLPLRAPDRDFQRAYDFRRFLQRELPSHFETRPQRKPLHAKLRSLKSLPDRITERWPPFDDRLNLQSLPIDHNVEPVPFNGGPVAGAKLLIDFLGQKLKHYARGKPSLDPPMTSGLSPYLHFGHVSAHQVFEALSTHESWLPAKVSAHANGKREGWWGMSAGAEAFLDQLVTWRELGYNFCAMRDDYDKYSSLPDWSRQTLKEHRKDERPFSYNLDQFERAETHDELWNAAQNQLRREGHIHNYLRMLWGKKVIHWCKSPQQALEIMVELNNKYGIDGRNPNSYSGIFWTLGRYDRPWGPEREIFGKVRYMSSQNTRRKLDVREYLKRWTNAE